MPSVSNQFFPSGIAGQVSAMLLFAMSLTVGILFASFLLDDTLFQSPVSRFMERTIDTAEALNRSQPSKRRDVLSHLEAVGGTETFTLLTQAPQQEDILDHPERGGQTLPPTDEGTESAAERHERLESSPDHHEEGEEKQQSLIVYVQLQDGGFLEAKAIVSDRPPLTRLILWGLLFLAASSIILLIWAGRSLVTPLRDLASAADTFGQGESHSVIKPHPIAEKGPLEIRIVARALNDMQARIHHLIEDRTRMLAAVGHDLRTPVTRLRLRVDGLDLGAESQAFLRDLDLMDGLLTRLLGYFRKGETGERCIKVDLGSLLDTIVNQWSDAGHEITLDARHSVTISGYPNQLLRMFDNLVDNGIKYASGCTIELKQQDELAIVRIIDHGPGISEDQFEAMQAPFTRGDESRNMDQPTGFGLGLAIAKETARHHDADLTLSTTKGGGLTITISFPTDSARGSHSS